MYLVVENNGFGFYDLVGDLFISLKEAEKLRDENPEWRSIFKVVK